MMATSASLSLSPITRAFNASERERERASSVVAHTPDNIHTCIHTYIYARAASSRYRRYGCAKPSETERSARRFPGDGSLCESVWLSLYIYMRLAEREHKISIFRRCDDGFENVLRFCIEISIN